jgi:hypothetical protein
MSTFQHLQRDKYGGGGIYALYPFDSPLVRKKCVFKIGMALNFDTRLHQYDTGSPAGVYVVAYLKNPLKNVVGIMLVLAKHLGQLQADQNQKTIDIFILRVCLLRFLRDLRLLPLSQHLLRLPLRLLSECGGRLDR